MSGHRADGATRLKIFSITFPLDGALFDRRVRNMPRFLMLSADMPSIVLELPSRAGSMVTLE